LEALKAVWAGAVIVSEGLCVPVPAVLVTESIGTATVVPSKVKLEEPAAALLPSLYIT
jgi:hypothetical protein